MINRTPRTLVGRQSKTRAELISSSYLCVSGTALSLYYLYYHQKTPPNQRIFLLDVRHMEEKVKYWKKVQDKFFILRAVRSIVMKYYY